MQHACVIQSAAQSSARLIACMDGLGTDQFRMHLCTTCVLTAITISSMHSVVTALVLPVVCLVHTEMML